MVDLDLSKIGSGKNILPELHKKTHFKGISNLLTNSREIRGFYNNAKLRSRFKALENSVSGSRPFRNVSRSIDLGNKKLKGVVSLYEKNSSIQYNSNNNLMLKKNSKKKLPKTINFKLDSEEISDYGHQGRDCKRKKNKRINSENNEKKFILPKPNRHMRGKLIEDNYGWGQGIDKRLGQDGNWDSTTLSQNNKSRISKISVSRKLQDSTDEGDLSSQDKVDIPLITKHILTQWGIVRCIP